MDDAVLDRIRDELELNDGLSGEQLVAAARQSLHLEGPVVDVVSQVREVCEELGFLPEDVPNATATLSVAAPPVDDAQRAAATCAVAVRDQCHSLPLPCRSPDIPHCVVGTTLLKDRPEAPAIRRTAMPVRSRAGRSAASPMGH